MENRSRPEQQARIGAHSLTGGPWGALVLCQVVAFLICFAPFAAANDLPFAPGERLVFNISWAKFLSAGEGILAVEKEDHYEGIRAWRFAIEGRTIGFIGRLYPVHDKTTAWFDPVKRRSLFVDISIQERSYRKHKTMRFDHETNRVTYQIDQRPPEVFPIQPGAFGPVSALYAFRTRITSRKPGATYLIPLFDDKKMYNLKIVIMGKEMVKLPMGRLRTVRAVADLQSEGVFRRKGKMTVWFSDDPVFAPVQVRTALPIGSLWAVLQSYQGAPLSAFVPEGAEALR